MRFGFRFLCCTVVSVASFVCATEAYSGTIRHDTSDSAYLGLASQDAYESVGMISIGSSLGSGTLIDEQWVLTAAHVADDGDPSEFTFDLAGQTYHASEVVIHPSWTGDLREAGDLALVRLDRAVQGVTPAVLYEGSNEVGQITTVVGFGKTGDGLTGATQPAGTKRAGQNVIGGTGTVVGYSPSSLMADFDEPDPFATFKDISLDLEYLVAQGDSGGGWFIEEGGQHYLAGVTSFGLAYDGEFDSTYSDVMGSTRVSDELDWIVSVMSALPADLSGDGDVDEEDLSLFFAAYTGPNLSLGPLTNPAADLSGDGDVDDEDLGLAFAQITGPLGPAPVPEPASLALIGLGGMIVVRRPR